MTDSTFRFDFKDLKIDVPQIEKILGYKEGDDSGIVSSLIQEIIDESHEFCNIRAEYKIYTGVEFLNASRSIAINKINFQVNKIVFGQIKNADTVAVFLCTAGAEIGIKSRQWMSGGDPLKGYIYDIFGSVVADGAADLMQDELEKSVTATGKKITNRYSPGYCGWDVAEQHKLFKLVPENFCGITLTDSALMNPVKSVSGIIGIGGHVRYNPYTCSLCELKDCVYRRVKEKKAVAENS